MANYLKIEVKKIIFLISAPRSGSSMLQQILNTHSAIKSLPEPWLMLPLVYIFKKNTKTSASYSFEMAQINMSNFFNEHPNIEIVLKDKIKEAITSIYQSFLSNEEYYFLDKTPRYYHIISELKDWFPDAKIILLARNPAAIFSSIMDYNFKGKTDWLEKPDRIHDILTAPVMLAKYKSDERCFFLRYEDLVKDTNKWMEELYEYLELVPPSHENLGDYHLDEVFTNTTAIDTRSVQYHQRPVRDYLDRWIVSIDSTRKKRFLREYLQHLDNDTWEKLGYSQSETLEKIKLIKVPWSLSLISFRLASGNYGNGRTLKDILLLKILLKFCK